MIDSSTAIDIATFSALEAEIRSLGKMALTGIQKRRPPKPPDVGMGLYYCGFSAVESRSEGAEEFSFAKAQGSGIVTTIHTKDVSTLIVWEYIIAVQGGLPPENFHFSCMSGGPMLGVVEGTIRSWALNGVIYEGPNTIPNDLKAIAGMEMILARWAHFILPDSQLDHECWAQTDMAWLAIGDEIRPARCRRSPLSTQMFQISIRCHLPSPMLRLCCMEPDSHYCKLL